jgi:5'-deoxynucleotidase YfbR-like HD superfamily hydrolase
MTWTQTYTGKVFDIFHPKPESICIEDIAHHLSQINRFTGATPFEYSVAQHSLLVSRLCEPHYALFGLLHDAAEAYLGDWPAPWKCDVIINGVDIHDIESDIQRAVHEKFGLLFWTQNEVERADKRALATERRDLMASEHIWPTDGDGYEPAPWPIREYEPAEVESMFLARFKELTCEGLPRLY